MNQATTERPSPASWNAARGRARVASVPIAMLLFGICLRTAFASVSSLMPSIAAGLRLSSSVQGLVSSLAIAVMALAAPAGAILCARAGPRRAGAIVLCVLSLAELARYFTHSIWSLLATTVVAGCGMGMGATVAPDAVRAYASPRHVRPTAGVFVSGLALGVALAAAASPSVARHWGDWHSGLAVWGPATAVVLVVWMLVLPKRERFVVSQALAGPDLPQAVPVMRHPNAWRITIYAATPMVIGFTAVAWLVSIFRANGASSSSASGELVIFQCVQLVTMLVLPIVAERMARPRIILATSSASAALGLALLLYPQAAVRTAAVALLGLGVGGSTALALGLIPRFSPDPARTRRLSSLVMGASLGLGAVGPFVLGALRDLTHSYAPGLIILLAAAVTSLALTPRLENNYRRDRACGASDDA